MNCDGSFTGFGQAPQARARSASTFTALCPPYGCFQFGTTFASPHVCTIITKSLYCNLPLYRGLMKQQPQFGKPPYDDKGTTQGFYGCWPLQQEPLRPNILGRIYAHDSASAIQRVQSSVYAKIHSSAFAAS